MILQCVSAQQGNTSQQQCSGLSSDRYLGFTAECVEQGAQVGSRFVSIANADVTGLMVLLAFLAGLTSVSLVAHIHHACAVLLAGLRQCVFDQRRNDLRLHTYAVRRLLFCRRRLRRRRPVREPLHLVAAHPRRRQSVTTSNSGREAVSTRRELICVRRSDGASLANCHCQVFSSCVTIST